MLTTYRVWRLEKGHDQQRKEIEDTQNNLRLSSQRLVEAQEIERARLSRSFTMKWGR